MASEIRERLFNIVVIVAAVLLLAFTWYTYIQNAKLQQKAAKLLAAREYPQVMTGLKVDIAQESTVLERWPEAAASPAQSGKKRLVLVTSDTCPYCKQTVPNWKRLLAGLEIDESREVWLLTFNTAELVGPLVSALKTRNTPFAVLAINDPTIFSLKTGIVGVPMTLVLDEDSTVALVCSGDLGDKEIAVFQDYMNGVSSPEKVFLTSGDVRTSPVTI